MLTDWKPSAKIKRGRPKLRREDDLGKSYRNWRNLTRDRKVWLVHEEAFILDWMKQQG